MHLIKDNRIRILILVLVAIASFFIWNHNIWSYQALTSDSNYYERVALNFIQGNGFTDKGEFQSVTLGYEFFIVLIYKIFGPLVNMVRLVQGLLFIFTIIFSYLIGKKLFSARVSFVAALFLAIFYPLPISAGVIGKELISAFLLTSFIFSTISWLDNRKLVYAFFGAFSLGFLVLALPVTKFLIVPLAAIFLYSEYRNIVSRNREVLLSSLIFFVTFIVTVSPLYALNLAYDDSLGLSDQGGGLYAKAEQMENVYKGYPAHFIGMSLGYYFSEQLYPNVNIHAFRDVPKTDARLHEWESKGVPESVYGPVLFEEGRRLIFSNPHKYALMSLLDFISLNSPLVPHGEHYDLNFIHLTFAEGRHSELPGIARAGYLLFIRGIWYLFLLAALYGVYHLWKRKKAETLFFIGVVFYWWMVYSLVHALPRYAIPLYPIYALFAFYGIYTLYLKWHEKTSHINPGVQRI